MAARIGSSTSSIERRLVIHRVAGVDAHGLLLLAGDATSSPDGWIDAQRDVVARVVSELVRARLSG